jgi:hypothetical protein
VLNDQYTGPDAWAANLARLEARTPVIEAIGVTDYYSLDTYERLQASKAAGRLPRCGLIFPNIEMRLAFGTVKGQWVNIHVLVSPERDDHLVEARRFLARLTFDAYDDTFACTPEDLIRLGRAAGAEGAERAALELGSQQFKVSFDQLKEIYRKKGWARDNTLIVVAGGDDGAGGLRDGSDATTRQEVLRSPTPSSRRARPKGSSGSASAPPTSTSFGTAMADPSPAFTAATGTRPSAAAFPTATASAG